MRRLISELWRDLKSDTDLALQPQLTVDELGQRTWSVWKGVIWNLEAWVVDLQQFLRASLVGSLML